LVEKHDKDFTAKLLVKNCPDNVEIAKKVIKHFSNDSYYEFAHKLLREMDLNFKEFPDAGLAVFDDASQDCRVFQTRKIYDP
jgi:hypothetical protein